MAIYLISLTVFTGVVALLVGLLLLIEGRVVQKGDRTIVINDDEEKSLSSIISFKRYSVDLRTHSRRVLMRFWINSVLLLNFIAIKIIRRSMFINSDN